ncbi:unnamed protein product [Durusdinium trenchii]|uniref:HU-CCDC81_euk_2 domain-containing protein n=2 Tax=Durusdinium trenchii TaxID=1381693 RepID=A0ABP0J5B5_9DINO
MACRVLHEDFGLLGGPFWPRRFHHRVAFADAPEEEARQEPSWPNILPIYLKTKLKRDLSADVDAALRKVGATRAAGRAKVQQDEMEAQLQQAKQTAKDISRQPADNQEAEKNKMMQLQDAMHSKQDLMKRELGATEQLLSADGRRDFAQEEQVEAEKNEMMVLQSIKDAETEAQRRVKGRNTVVGAPATNKFGMIIETKQVCDQEKGTEWHNGRCIVSGEKQSPDTPEEVAAMTAVKAAQANYDESLEVVHSKNHTFKEADHKLKQTKADLEVYQNHHSTSTPKAQELRTKMENAKAVWDQAHVALNDAKAASKEKREKLSEALRKAIDVERNEEEHDDEDLHTIHQVQHRAENDIERSEDEIARLEEEQAEVVGGMAQKLQTEALKYPVDSTQRQDLEKEAHWFHAWQGHAKAEAHDLHERNLKAYVSDHVKEQQAAQRENDASHQAFADAASEGRDQDAFERALLKPPDETEKDPKEILQEENEHLSKLMKTDAGAGDDELKATKDQSEVQNHKNSLEFREFSNLKALHDASKTSAASMGSAFLASAASSTSSTSCFCRKKPESSLRGFL